MNSNPISSVNQVRTLLYYKFSSVKLYIMSSESVPIKTKNNSKADIRQENQEIILRAAEQIFAEYGFRGATTKMIADLAGIPKANLHYYYPTKLALYQVIVEDIFEIWLSAAETFEDNKNPIDALSSYIDKKMALARSHPYSSKVWANEVMHGAPIIQDYLENNLATWTKAREANIQTWIDEGLLDPIDPKHLLYMIWATTQHYADFNHQIQTLNGGTPLSNQQWADASRDVKKIILTGVGARAASAKSSTIMPELKTRIQREKTEKILAAALEVFSNYGFRGSTIDQIANQAGMSKPNILYYFDSKEAIHSQLLAQLLDIWLQPLHQMDEKGEPIAEILAYIERKLQMSRDFPRESRLFANEVLQGAPHINNLIGGGLKSLVDQKAKLINSWCKAGKIATIDPYHLIFAIWATTQHYADFDAQIRALMGVDSANRYQGAEVFLEQLFKTALKP